MPGLAMLAGMISVFAAACPTDTLFGAYEGTKPGASVAVIKDGAVIFERNYGLANVEKSEPATSQTNYRLASVTKEFTAMSILMLSEKGSLKLDDPVSRYLPELKETAPKITLRHLLTHTSGLPEYETMIAKGDTKQVFDRDVLAMVAAQKLELPAPGTKFRYNNSGYALLALVVERVSKVSYSEFLRRNIFKPLGMSDTTTCEPNAKIVNRAYGYTGPDDVFTLKDQTPSTTVLGDGGIYSSTRDLAHWIDALDHSTLINPKLLADATRAHIPTGDPGVSYGYGWRISEQRGEKLVFHTGTTSGFKNALLWVPSRKLAVVVLTNRKQGEPLTLAKVVLDQFWGK